MHVDSRLGGDPPGRQASERWLSKDGQRAYSVTLHLPEGAAPAHGFPLMVLLDGAWVSEASMQVERGTAVALVMHEGEPEAVKAGRAFDFTPPLANTPQPADPRTPRWRNGGADGFLQLLDTAMLPWMLAQAPVDCDGVTLFGHSYGALCVLRGLYAGAFARVTRCVLASPSVWWHDGAVDQALPITGLQASHRPAVLFLAGEHERWHAQAVGPDGTAQSREGGRSTLAPIRAAAERWAATGGHEVYLDVVPQGTHHSMLAQSLAPAFEFARQPRTALGRTWRPVDRWSIDA